MYNLSAEAQKQLEIEMSKLKKQNQQLQQENKVLQLRATGVQVLGKVLQDSQDESEQLKHQVEQLQQTLKKAGIEEPTMSSCPSDATLSYKSGSPTSCNPSLCLQSNSIAYTSTLLSDPFSSVLPNKQLQFCSQTGPSSLCHLPELQTKELHHKFGELKEVLEKQNHVIHVLTEKMNTLDSEDCKGELQVKLGRLKNRIQTSEKEAKTREAYIAALMTKEEDLKAKWADVEAEQLSQENVAQQLFRNVEEDKEELERLQDEIAFYNNTVLANKQQVTRENNKLEKETISSNTSERSQEIGEAATVRENPVNHDSGAEDFQKKYEQLHLQYIELQGTVETLRSERDEAVKQKEEILDVNHLWDTQYRQLQAETTQEISELKQKIELLTFDDSQKRFDKLWMKTRDKVDIERKAKEKAQEENQIYQERCKSLEEELKKVNDEIKSLQLSLEQKGKHVSLLQENLSRVSPISTVQYGTSTQQVLPTERISDTSEQRAPAVIASDPVAAAPPSLHAPPEIVDQIEMLKAQLRLYVDDFLTERNDRERAQAEKHKLTEELKASKEQIIILEAQMEQFHNDWKKEKEEKENLQRTIQTAASSGRGQAPSGLEYQGRVQLTQKAQAIAEQQARLKRMREDQEARERILEQERQTLEQEARELALHRGYDNPHNTSNREPRFLAGGLRSNYSPYTTTGHVTQYTPEYLQHPHQPYLQARGPTQPYSDQRRPLEDIFQGGDVQPDSDPGYEVIDGAGSGDGQNDVKVKDNHEDSSDNQCPRCLRTFKQTEHELLLKHIEKCIS